ncbi:MAG TPA: LL-diaminopimelate aminotransferase [Armatimonadota bacterium]|nr:LL-diaminopimelate aminotransferase [Armatimonadota bacterium]
MQYAKRLDLIPPYLFGEIARMKAKAIEEGRDLIDLGIGDPDQPTPQIIIDKLAEAAKDPVTHRYDETECGWPMFLESVGRWYKKRFGVDICPKTEAVLLIGSKEGLVHFAWAMVDPGDVVLVPDPAYTAYKMATLLAGGEPVVMPLLEENGFLPDLTAIPSDVAHKAKVMYLNYPNNPTGAIATVDFFRDVVAFAKEYDIAVCHDCAYSEVFYEDYRPPSFLEAEGAKDVGIEMHSLSKTYNMTGWRIGMAVGNSELIRALNKLKSNVDSRQFPAIDIAAAHALEHVDNAEKLALYRKRRDILVEGLNKLGWEVKKPLASLYVWAKIPSGYTSAEFVKTLLQDAGVLAIPGNGYGQYGEGYIRMSLTVSGDKDGERVHEAVQRIAKHIKF